MYNKEGVLNENKYHRYDQGGRKPLNQSYFHSYWVQNENSLGQNLVFFGGFEAKHRVFAEKVRKF